MNILSVNKFAQRLFARSAIIYSNLFVLPRLKNKLVQARFSQLSTHYAQVFSRFSGVVALDRTSDGYSWDSWSGKIRSAFEGGVSIDFLADRLIAFTMVFAGGGGMSMRHKYGFLLVEKYLEMKPRSSY